MSMPAWLPFVVGVFLVVQFAALGVWQINRGLEKRADRAAFADRSSFAQFNHGNELRPYQAIEANGHFDSGRQFLIDNIILNARYGYYVLTAFEIAEDEPLLIVNRGWIEKPGLTPDVAAIGRRIAVTESPLTVRGRASSLARPSGRMGEAIRSRDTWPQVAVFPNPGDLALSLGRDVEAIVLLMDPGDEHGFLRHWVPEEMGPGKHFGYALQWFAMGAALAGLLIWNARKRGSDS
jgi:cytochrome oxidase assembly protein ShyY1